MAGAVMAPATYATALRDEGLIHGLEVKFQTKLQLSGALRIDDPSELGLPRIKRSIGRTTCKRPHGMVEGVQRFEPEL